MRARRGAAEHALAGEVDAPREVRILLVEEQLVPESTNLVEDVARHGERGTGGAEDLVGLGVERRRRSALRCPAEAEVVHTVAGRVEVAGRVAQHHALGGSSVRVGREARHERGRPVRLRAAVKVEEQQHAALGERGTLVAGPPEPHVLAVAYELNLGSPLGLIGGAVRRGVVDHDRLDLQAALPRDRVEAPVERAAALVVDDHDRRVHGDAAYARGSPATLDPCELSLSSAPART